MRRASAYAPNAVTKRDRILAAASVLFRVGGIEAVSIRRIAAEVGSSPMAIYRHYGSRDEIVETLVQAGFRDFEQWLSEVERPSDPIKRVRALGQAYLDFALRKPDQYALMFLAYRPSSDPFLQDYKARQSPSLEMLRTAVEEAMRRGALARRDSLEVSLTIWAHLHGLVALFLAGRFGRGDQLFRKLYVRSLDRLLNGLRFA